MAMQPRQPIHIAQQSLRDMVCGIFEASGMQAGEAGIVADVLVWANLRGIDSHGVSRVPRYLELFASGEAKPRARMQVRHARPGILLIDADGAPGPVALKCAIDEAMAVARAEGVCWVSIRATVHTGAIGYYTEHAAKHGFAVIGMVAGMPNMAYPNSAAAALGTSPISISMPAGASPTPTLDMATAAITLGNIAQARIHGIPLPDGCALTADGQPTTDAAQAAIPLPMAGPKGAGLSLMLELLCGVLADNPIVAPYHEAAPEGQRHRQNALFIVADVSAFLDESKVRGLVDRTLGAIKRLPPCGADEVMIPGERGQRSLTRRKAEGIPLAASTWKKLVENAEKLGVPPAQIQE